MITSVLGKTCASMLRIQHLHSDECGRMFLRNVGADLRHNKPRYHSRFFTAVKTSPLTDKLILRLLLFQSRIWLVILNQGDWKRVFVYTGTCYDWIIDIESVRTVDLPEMLRTRKLNIWIKVFCRRYIHYLKEYEWNNCKFINSLRTLSAADY
jgi:hypothetical protein